MFISRPKNLHCKPIPVMKTGISLCTFPNREKPVFTNWEPCNENRFFPVWEKYTRKTLYVPVLALYGIAVCLLHLPAQTEKNIVKICKCGNGYVTQLRSPGCLFLLPAKFYHCQDRDKNSRAHYNLDCVSLLHNM